MSELPEGWTIVSLREVLEDHQPGFASGKKNVQGGVRHLRMNNIGTQGELVLDLVRTVPTSLAKPHYELKTGDVLVCTTNSSMLVGKCALFDLEGQFVFSNHLTRLNPQRERISSAYLARHLWLLWQAGEFEDKCKHWVNQSTLPKEKLLETRILLPPLNEQRRIVAKLDELLAKVEACQKRLAKIPVILKLFRRSVLGAAFSGRLTKDWREQSPRTEAVFVAIDRMKKSSEKLHIRRGVPETVSHSDEVKNWVLPQTWGCYSAAELLRCGALVDLKDGNHGANHPRVTDFTDTGLPFITAAQVNGFRIDYEGAYKLSGGPLDRIQVGFAKAGDVIYTHKGSVGRVAITDRDCVLTPQTTYYRVSAELLDNRFLMLYLASPFFSDQVDIVKAQTTRDFVPISEQYLLFHRVAPLAEQQEIVRRVDALFKYVDQIEARHKKAQEQVNKLTQSILAKAFRGELVPTEVELARREGHR